MIFARQYEFCPRPRTFSSATDTHSQHGSLAVSGGRDIIPLINELLASPHFALKVATQDYHPANHISFAANHPGPNNKPFESFVDVKNLVANKPEQTMKQRLWPVHCVQQTKGAEIIDEIDLSKVDITVKKGMDWRVEMYSAFSDSFGNMTYGSGGVNLDLANLLSSQKISHVYVVGLAGDYCVKDTALGSAKAGFITYIIEEAQKCVDPGTWADIKAAISQCSVSVVSAKGEEVQRVLNN